jgi:hypothetical protein
MTAWEALILGVVQGLTEFFPVSSSGHLVMTGAVLGLQVPGILFEIAVHVATLLSVLVVYRAKIWQLALGCSADGGERLALRAEDRPRHDPRRHHRLHAEGLVRGALRRSRLRRHDDPGDGQLRVEQPVGARAAPRLAGDWLPILVAAAIALAPAPSCRSSPCSAWRRCSWAWRGSRRRRSGAPSRRGAARCSWASPRPPRSCRASRAPAAPC